MQEGWALFLLTASWTEGQGDEKKQQLSEAIRAPLGIEALKIL